MNKTEYFKMSDNVIEDTKVGGEEVDNAYIAKSIEDVNNTVGHEKEQLDN